MRCNDVTKNQFASFSLPTYGVPPDIAQNS